MLLWRNLRENMLVFGHITAERGVKDMSEQLLWCRKSDVLSREVRGETLVLNLSRYSYYAMSETASVLWKALERQASVGSLADLVCGSFDVERELAIADVCSFLAELEGQGLVEGADSASAAAFGGPVAIAREIRPYAAPRLEMVELRAAACATSCSGPDAATPLLHALS